MFVNFWSISHSAYGVRISLTGILHGWGLVQLMGAIEVGRMAEVGPHSYTDSTDGWVLVARNVAYSSDEMPPRWP